ncbi:MAG: hypothetical protein RR482_04970, partial [Clostridia bacterium]
ETFLYDFEGRHARPEGGGTGDASDLSARGRNMSYLLEINQEEIRNIVGIFDTLENAQAFLESIPFVKKTVDAYGASYHMAFGDLPVLYTASYRGWQYVIGRDSYAPERQGNEISLDLMEITRLDATPPRDGTYVTGDTRLDAYSFPNDAIAQEIEKREALYSEAKAYYARQGRKVARSGLGSQDGEYVLVSEKNKPKQMHLTFLLEPQSVEAREKAGNFEAFIQSISTD